MDKRAYIDWITKEALPKYNKSLRDYNAPNLDVRIYLVRNFCRICGEMKFLDFSRLPTDLIKEFSSLYAEAVTSKNKLSKEEVWKYLKDFFLFLELYYGLRYSKQFLF